MEFIKYSVEVKNALYLETPHLYEVTLMVFLPATPDGLLAEWLRGDERALGSKLTAHWGRPVGNWRVATFKWHGDDPIDLRRQALAEVDAIETIVDRRKTAQ